MKATTWGSGRSIWGADLGARPRAEDVTVDVEPPSSVVADALELGDGARVVVRRRRYVVDDKPVQLAVSSYPEELVAGSAIAEINTGDGGAYARLAELGYEPVVLIVRTAYTAEDRSVEVTEMVLDSASYVLEYKFTSHD